MEEQITQMGDDQATPAGVADSTVELDTGGTELETPTSEEVAKSPEEYERELEGLKKGIQAEREKRRLYEDIARRGYAQQPQQPQAPQYADEDYVQFGDVRKYVDSILGQVKQQYRNDQVRVSIDRAKGKYSDFDEATELANELSLRDPALTDYVLNSVDPGEAIYQVARLHPSWTGKAEKETAKKITQKIAQNTKQPRTLSDAGAGAGPAEFSSDRIKNMSHEEFEALVRKRKGY